jgi:hypothetical protein
VDKNIATKQKTLEGVFEYSQLYLVILRFIEYTFIILPYNKETRPILYLKIKILVFFRFHF